MIRKLLEFIGLKPRTFNFDFKVRGIEVVPAGSLRYTFDIKEDKLNPKVRRLKRYFTALRMLLSDLEQTKIVKVVEIMELMEVKFISDTTTDIPLISVGPFAVTHVVTKEELVSRLAELLAVLDTFCLKEIHMILEKYGVEYSSNEVRLSFPTKVEHKVTV